MTDMTRLKSRLAPAMIVAGVCILLGIYVAGYFAGGTRAPSTPLTIAFRWKTLCVLYAPMGKLEAHARGAEVWLCYTSDDGVSVIFDRGYER